MPTNQMRKPQPVDITIGSKIKTRRLILKQSQEELASALGITFQQVQKYEKGINRISLGRLIDISTALGVAPDYFFEKIHLKKGISTPKNKQSLLEQNPEILDIAQSFLKIKSPNIRKNIIQLVKLLSTAER